MNMQHRDPQPDVFVAHFLKCPRRSRAHTRAQTRALRHDSKQELLRKRCALRATASPDCVTVSYLSSAVGLSSPSEEIHGETKAELTPAGRLHRRPEQARRFLGARSAPFTAESPTELQSRPTAGGLSSAPYRSPSDLQTFLCHHHQLCRRHKLKANNTFIAKNLYPRQSAESDYSLGRLFFETTLFLRTTTSKKSQIGTSDLSSLGQVQAFDRF